MRKTVKDAQVSDLCKPLVVGRLGLGKCINCMVVENVVGEPGDHSK